MSTERTGTKARGFASMSADRQREIARKGGRAAHECGKAHEFTTDEARAAGRKGGEAVSANRTHMSEIGRLGGRRSAGRRASVNQAAVNHAGDHVGSHAGNGVEPNHSDSNPADPDHHSATNGHAAVNGEDKSPDEA